MWKLLWMLFLSSFSGGLSNTIDAFGRAGEHVALLPIQEDVEESKIVPEMQPTFYDLAISRLQSKVEEVIDGVWMELNDKVNIFTEKKPLLIASKSIFLISF